MLLVTAANGRLGQKIITALLKKTSADRIVAAARDPGKLVNTAAQKVQCRRADYDIPSTLRSASANIDTLILVPSPAPKTQRIQQHRDVIAAARSNNVRTIVFVSFMDTRADSPLPYAHIFADTENALAESALSWTNMRMPYYIDNLLYWLPKSLETGGIFSSAGDGRMPYVTQTDLAESIATVATMEGHAGKTYELTGPESLSYDDLATLASDIYGKQVTYKALTAEAHQHYLRSSGATEYCIEIALGLAAAIKEGAFDRVTTHVEQLAGYPPESVQSFFNCHPL